jgi:hypothetical protein
MKILSITETLDSTSFNHKYIARQSLLEHPMAECTDERLTFAKQVGKYSFYRTCLQSISHLVPLLQLTICMGIIRSEHVQKGKLKEIVVQSDKT